MERKGWLYYVGLAGVGFAGWSFIIVPICNQLSNPESQFNNWLNRPLTQSEFATLGSITLGVLLLIAAVGGTYVWASSPKSE